MNKPLNMNHSQLSASGNKQTAKKPYTMPSQAGTFDMMTIWEKHGKDCDSKAKEQVTQSVNWTISQVADSMKLISQLLSEREANKYKLFDDKEILNLVASSTLLNAEILDYCTSLTNQVADELITTY